MNYPIDWGEVDPSEDLSSDTQMIYDVIGLEKTAELVEQLGGVRLHIQSPRPLRDQQAKEKALELSGEGLDEVAVCRRTGLTMHQLRRLLKRKRAA